MPHTIELGRSFVSPELQVRKASRKTIFTLDNLWDGLGALIIDKPHIKYFFGKVTMYQDFNRRARNLILFFFRKHFYDSQKLMSPINAIEIDSNNVEFKNIFNKKTYIENYKILAHKIRGLGEFIPPLINSYMNISPTMKTFGTALNTKFGNVEETGIIITINDIYKSKKHRHLTTYTPKKV